MAFPTNIVLHLTIGDFPYALAWIWTGYSIVRCVVAGAIAGAMNKS